MSKTFEEIKRIVKKYKLNGRGFKVGDITSRTNRVKKSTITTFIPKHVYTNIKYFVRIDVGTYKIKSEFLNG